MWRILGMGLFQSINRSNQFISHHPIEYMSEEEFHNLSPRFWTIPIPFGWHQAVAMGESIIMAVHRFIVGRVYIIARNLGCSYGLIF